MINKPHELLVHLSLLAIFFTAPACMAQRTSASAKTAAPTVIVDTQNYIAGTQVFGGDYQFTDQSLLVEGASQLLDMGSNMIKFAIGPGYTKHHFVKQEDPRIQTLTDLAKQRDYKQVFDMPFSRYFLWTYCFSTNEQVTPFHGHMAKQTLANEYQEMYDLTKYLLTTYNGTGKTFYLGNWEGDWGLNSGAPPAEHKWETEPNSDAPTGMIDWLTARQRAIDTAKRDTPHKDVEVWFYVETNLVQKSIKQGRVSVASAVLPFVNPDFVSYSSYDSTNPGLDMHHTLPAALDYMQSKLKPKQGLPEKRVFVGEYTSLALYQTPNEQDARMRDIIATGIKWGTPFVIYWQLYGNTDKGKPPEGCWLIDTKGVKLPVYYTYQHFYADAKLYIAEYVKKNQRQPDDKEFHDYAYKWFTSPNTKNDSGAWVSKPVK